MSFPEKLVTAATRVDQYIGRILADRSQNGTPERLAAAIRHAVLGGGKRFRPFLVIESAGLFGLSPEAAMPTAAGIEFLHCYSLVHDDLPCMDNDDLRRGQPTVHRAYDEWTAVLAGDALATLAFEVLSEPLCHVNPAVRSELVLTLARAAGGAGMVGGQALDLEAGKLGQPAVATPHHIENLQAMKTGRLIAFAAEAGAILGEAAAADRARLVRFGVKLGAAFQISDDILDAEGDAATVGKATRKDEQAGKATLVSLIGLDAARGVLADTVAEAIASLDVYGAKAEALCGAARFMQTRKT